MNQSSGKIQAFAEKNSVSIKFLVTFNILYPLFCFVLLILSSNLANQIGYLGTLFLTSILVILYVGILIISAITLYILAHETLAFWYLLIVALTFTMAFFVNGNLASITSVASCVFLIFLYERYVKRLNTQNSALKSKKDESGRKFILVCLILLSVPLFLSLISTLFFGTNGFILLAFVIGVTGFVIYLKSGKNKSSETVTMKEVEVLHKPHEEDKSRT